MYEPQEKKREENSSKNKNNWQNAVKKDFW